MIQFQKKVKKVSTTEKLQKEAKKFQNAVSEINAGYKPTQINISLVEGVAKKYGIEANVIAEAFQTYLKKNALNAIRAVKATSDYTVLDLEQAAAGFGFDLDSLNVTYFSKD